MSEPMLTVLRDIERPPGDWRYTVPETGVTVTGGFYSELRSKVLAHRRANHLPIPDDYDDFLADAACRETNPPGGRCGKKKPKPVAKPIKHLMLLHVERFLVVVWQAVKDRKFVSKEEAERRADVCRGCPYRTTTPGGCTGCFTLLKKANDLLQKRGAIEFEADGDGFVRDCCGACGCFLPLKVVLENSTLNRAEGSNRPAYWEGCWRNA